METNNVNEVESVRLGFSKLGSKAIYLKILTM